MCSAGRSLRVPIRDPRGDRAECTAVSLERVSTANAIDFGKTPSTLGSSSVQGANVLGRFCPATLISRHDITYSKYYTISRIYMTYGRVTSHDTRPRTTQVVPSPSMRAACQPLEKSPKSRVSRIFDIVSARAIDWTSPRVTRIIRRWRAGHDSAGDSRFLIPFFKRVLVGAVPSRPLAR